MTRWDSGLKEREEARALIIRGGPYTPEEMEQVLKYYRSDAPRVADSRPFIAAKWRRPSARATKAADHRQLSFSFMERSNDQ
jgi:hypothetical protein